MLLLQEAAINNAIGEAETISKRSQATADGLRMIAGSIAGNAGSEAVSMTVAQQYVEAFGKIAKTGAPLQLALCIYSKAACSLHPLAVWYNMLLVSFAVPRQHSTAEGSSFCCRQRDDCASRCKQCLRHGSASHCNLPKDVRQQWRSWHSAPS